MENKRSNVRVAIAEGTDVPLYIPGSSTDSAHLAAKKGLSYGFASHFASTYLLQALKIYHGEFKPRRRCDNPIPLSGINVLVADTYEEAEQLITSLFRMFVGVLTAARDPLQPPITLTEDLKELFQHPSLH